MNSTAIQLVFAKESIEQVFDQIVNILRVHYEELSGARHYPLNPDYERYKQLERAGILRIYTAREDDDLIGYSIFFVMPNMHYVDQIIARNDIYYLLKEYRRGSHGIRFLKYCDDQLQAEGVNRIIMATKVNQDNGVILDRIGYELHERLFIKDFDHGR